MAGTVRELIAEKIKADNSAFIVKPYPASAPENIPTGKAVVHIWRELLTNSPQLAAVTQTLKALVMVTGQPSEAGENKLEDALFGVLTSLSSLGFVEWNTAERATFYEKFSGYEISLQAHTENIYKASPA